MIKLSVVICTLNRSGLLIKCLDSLILQLDEKVEIVVVDNDSRDSTVEIVKNYYKRFRNLKIIIEKITGLSHARNRGFNNVKSEWVLYIDDDAIAFPNLIERALYLVKKEDFDCIGGMYYGYYESEKPKWIPNDFGSKYKYSEQLTECPYSIPCGGIVLYRKSMLETLGGFSGEFGMSGIQKNLGEETELQFRASQLGYKIGFDPDLKVYHLVKPEYTSLRWFLKRSFLEGKTNVQISKNHEFSILLFKNIRSVISLIFRRFPINFFKWVTKSNYYWQNLVYDSLMPNSLFFGQLLGALKKD